MLDLYFKKPVFFDYSIGIILMGLMILGINCNYTHVPTIERIYSLVADVTNISLTSSGFILTLLTVLITFKSGSSLTKENYTDKNTTFELFFASALYFETVKHLKNCVKSLIFIAMLGFTLKMIIPITAINLIHYFNVIGIVIIGLTLWRCLLILTQILNMQKDN